MSSFISFVNPVDEQLSHALARYVKIDGLVITDGASPYPLEHLRQRIYLRVDDNILGRKELDDVGVSEPIDHISDVGTSTVLISGSGAGLKEVVAKPSGTGVYQLIHIALEARPKASLVIPARDSAEELPQIISQSLDILIPISSLLVPRLGQCIRTIANSVHPLVVHNVDELGIVQWRRVIWFI